MNIDDIKNFLETEFLLSQLKINYEFSTKLKFNKLIFKQISYKYNWLQNLSELIYLIKHKDELENLHIFCPTCGNKNKFQRVNIGYFNHCCKKCAFQDKNVINKIILSAKSNIDENGENSYQRGAKKAAIIKKSTIGEDGLNIYQRSLKKAEQTIYRKTGFKHHQQTKEWKDKIKSKRDQIQKSSGDTCEKNLVIEFMLEVLIDFI